MVLFTERLAAEEGLEIEFVRKLDDFRKERRIKDILKLRGEHPGLVHIFAAMESCRTGHYEGELGSRLSTRMEGTCLKHYMADSGIKMYDKFGVILRLEAVTNDVTFFQHYRKVEHRDGTWQMKQAPMRKTIYSLPGLAEALSAANRRYLEFLSAVEDPTNGIREVQQVSRRVQENDRRYKGFNLFDEADLRLFRVLSRGEFNLRGLRSGDLCQHLPAKSPGQVSHLLRRLRNHGILKKAQKCYKYYVTSLGKRIIASALKLKEMFIIPSLRGLLPQP